MTPTVLIIAADQQSGAALRRLIACDEWRVEWELPTARSEHPAACAPDCVLVLFERGKLSQTLAVCEQLKASDDNLPIILFTTSKSLDDAVAAMKAGAFDYFSAPFDAAKLKRVIAHALRLYALTKRVFLLENHLGTHGGLADLLGQSPAMQELFAMIRTVAKTNTTVLIEGESGTGKELVAKAIHRLSHRAKGVFLDINCGAIPRELLENEMFGHERGAFTGADRRAIGSFERANGGTLFLDEIAEMDPSLQVKLLRFLQERNFTRVGGNELVNVDVRIVTATNRTLSAEVKAGRFREDLYFRLNVVPLLLPPLRKRREDIPLLAKFFLQKYATKNDKIFLDFAPQAMEALMAHQWPGNVRELENVIERVVVLENDSRVKLAHLPEPIRAVRREERLRPVLRPTGIDGDHVLPLDLVEKYAIEAALKICCGNVAAAATKLRIGQATLYRKIKEYGLSVEEKT